MTADGHEIVRLVRRRAQGPDEASWSPSAGIIDFHVMDRVDAVVNLSGASLVRLPWTKSYRGEIVDSRVSATRTLADAMRKARRPPPVFLSASAVGFYGDRPGELLTEFSSAGSGFLAEVVQRWEAAAALAPDETRTVMFRTGVVVGHGGAMQRIGILTRFGLSGRLGTGGQHWPWISLHDEVSAIVAPAHFDALGAGEPRRPHARDRRSNHDRRWPSGCTGPTCSRCPSECSNSRSAVPPTSCCSASQKVRPQRLIDDGYRFTHVTVESALDGMLSAPRAPRARA